MALRHSTLLARLGLQQALRAASCGAGRQLGARTFAAEAGQSSGSGKWIAGLAAVGAGVWGAKELGYIDFGGKGGKTMSIPLISEPKRDYGAVRQAIEDILDAPEGYDDGSYGPVLVRLAWHASGTYDKATNSGGSNGATMRWAPESNHAANAGLQVARELLEPIKKQFPWISYADLWTLAGATAVEAMGGPAVPWRPGRKDSNSETDCPPDMRLPDAGKGAPHVREVFGRMGFEDRDTVALIGAHSLGRCHTDRSGYKGPWTNAPTTFSNLYFQELVNNKWRKKKWDGPLQYEDKTGELMMLPTDMALLWDKKFKQYVDEYAKDEDKFFKDFASAFSTLMELGVPFPNAATTAAT